MAALTPKKQANKSASKNSRICKCSFSIKFETGKLGRISTENLFETSNREGSRGTTLALMCASVGIVINRLSHLSDRVCNFCGRKVRKLFQLFSFGKELEKRKRVFRAQLVSNGNYRLLFRPLREALQTAKCFEHAYMKRPRNLHREKSCSLQCKGGVNTRQKIIFSRNI